MKRRLFVTTTVCMGLAAGGTRAELPPDVSALLGAWSTRVPGGVWQSPSAIPGWDRLNIGIGALAGLLVIYADGSYIWNAYGGKKATWKATDDLAYPILLDDPAEHRTWQVGPNNHKPDAIYIREGRGMFWYEGHKAR